MALALIVIGSILVYLGITDTFEAFIARLKR